MDTYVSPDGEEDIPVYSNEDKNVLEAYNPRPSVGFEYDVYGTGSPTTDKGDDGVWWWLGRLYITIINYVNDLSITWLYW